MWYKQTGFWIPIGVILLAAGIGIPVGLHFNSQSEKVENSEYLSNLPSWVQQRWKYSRNIIADSNLPKEVRSSIPKALKILNGPLKKRFGISQRFNRIAGVPVRITNHQGGVCANLLDNTLAELAKDGSGFVVRLCVNKVKHFMNARILPKDKGSQEIFKLLRRWGDKMWTCVLAHEIAHTDWYKHTTGCGLMSAGGCQCELNSHELNIWKKHIFPKIRK